MNQDTFEKNYPKYKEIFEASLTGSKEEKARVCQKYNITTDTFRVYRSKYLNLYATPEEKERYGQKMKSNSVAALAEKARAHEEGKRLAYLTSLNLSYRTLLKVMTLIKPTTKEKSELKKLECEMKKTKNHLEKTKLNEVIDAMEHGIVDELCPDQKRAIHPLDLYVTFNVTPLVLEKYCTKFGTKEQLLCLSTFLEKNKEKFSNKKTFSKLVEETEFAFSTNGDFCTREEKERYKQYMIDHKIPKNLVMFNEVGRRIQQGRIKIEEPAKRKLK